MYTSTHYRSDVQFHTTVYGIPVFHTGIYYKQRSRRSLTSQLPASIIPVLNNCSIPENLKNSINADVVDLYTKGWKEKRASISSENYKCLEKLH